MNVVPVFALLQQAPAGRGGSLLPFLFQVVAIFGIFYFIMIRPQRKQRRQHEDRLRNLKRGDRVVTAGGIIGEVVHLKEPAKDAATPRALDDEVTIKSGESRLLVERGRIARVLGTEASADPTAQR